MPIAAGILMVAIVLVQRKEWRNLGRNLLMGLGVRAFHIWQAITPAGRGFAGA